MKLLVQLAVFTKSEMGELDRIEIDTVVFSDTILSGSKLAISDVSRLMGIKIIDIDVKRITILEM